MKRIALILLIVICPSSVLADFDAGKAAYERGDYATALKELQPLAERGNAEAQYMLGKLYRSGDGIPRDAEYPYHKRTAESWYLKAAKQGHAESQFELGLMYFNGEGVPQDKVRAASWYQKAAEQGHVESQFELAKIYYWGIGVPRDSKQAFSWYQKVAEQGNTESQFRLGMMYYSGDGVPQDYKQAHMWLSLAGADSEKNLAEFILKSELEPKMSLADVTKAQEMAKDWLAKHPKK